MAAPGVFALIAPNFLFRFSVPCRRVASATIADADDLDESYRLPCFSELEGRQPFAEVRLGWHETGLLFRVTVTGKQQPLWCRPSRIEDSDGVQLWIDTRDTHNVHRASRFCHRFALLPSGGGQRLDKPSVALLAINRARESPRPPEGIAFSLRSTMTANGYRLAAIIPGAALTGWDSQEHRKLGFFWAVSDRELGWQTFSLGPELPIAEDPSLWGTLELAADLGGR